MADRSCRLLASLLPFGLAGGLAVAQQPVEPVRQSPFRAGAHLVRVDAYVSLDGRPVTDLTAADFEVLEDGVPQTIQQFELVVPRPPGPEADRVEPETVREAAALASDPHVRLFVLFMDVWHVQLSGSYRAQGPVARLLERLIGQDDMVGVMTPEMSASNLTFARRTSLIRSMLETTWFWGEHDRGHAADPREAAYQACYAAHPGVHEEMVDRRRVQKTLSALEDLIVHLEGVREERKFVLLLSEGWRLSRRSEALAARLGTERPVDPVSVQPGGRLALGGDPRETAGVDWAACERDRQLLANLDNELTFRLLVQRAARSNVTVYGIDPRGLVASDQPAGVRGPARPDQEASPLRARQDALRTLAHETDGAVVLETNDVDRAIDRFMTDLASYYLIGYSSTNMRLDGRYRRLTVRVRRPGVHVRARPGYVAPLESDVRAPRAPSEPSAEPAARPVPGAALSRLGATRAAMPLRVEATGFWPWRPGPGAEHGDGLGAQAGGIWVVVEIDSAVLRQEEWLAGGTVRLTVEPPPNLIAEPYTHVVPLPAGQRVLAALLPHDTGLEPGRYVVRAQAAPADGGWLPLQASVGTDVPAPGALLPSGPLVRRRGPTTGLQYEPTADPRFRRTERLRLEIPASSGEATISARLLGRDGQALPLPVEVSDRRDEASGLRLLVADLVLAPLAQGEYVLELVAARGGARETVAYAFRIVP